MRHPLFRLFSSVKLAVVLLCVLIVASIVGTIYETSFDSRVARAYIYNAWWFNLWLLILCLNLACSAFSRWPWRRHHTGFLLTHLGIIVLLVGAMIGRRWGIEGTMTLFEGQGPDNRLEIVDENVLRIEERGGSGGTETRQFPVEIIGRHPTPAKPWPLGKTGAGWDLALVDYAPALAATFAPQAVGANVPGVGQPAVRVRLASRRLGQNIEQWLLAGDAEHGALDLGLAAVTVQAGVAPDAEPAGPAAASPAAAGPAAPTPAPTDAPHDPVDERLFALAQRPGESKRLPAPGSAPSGVELGLKLDAGKPVVLLTWQGATWHLDPVADRGRDEELGGAGLHVTVEDYWPDLVVGEGDKLSTASQEPRNPAVLVRVHGRPAGDTGDAAPTPAAAVNPAAAPGVGSAADNRASIYCDPAGKLTFVLRSGALAAPARGELKLGEAVNTGWADWQVTALETLPVAAPHTDFRPAPSPGPVKDDMAATSGDPRLVNNGGGSNPDANPASNPANPGDNRPGVRVRLTRAGSAPVEQWTPLGWEFTLPTTPGPTRLSYGPRVEPLPVGLQLEQFHVTFNEGTDNPAAFRSDLRATDIEGGVGTGSCSMNHPFNFPGSWWNTFSGQTYKMSQASWNPQDRNQSTIQILRDPGWLLKWLGSLFICAGIFALFYLRPAQGGRSVKPPVPTH